MKDTEVDEDLKRKKALEFYLKLEIALDEQKQRYKRHRKSEYYFRKYLGAVSKKAERQLHSRLNKIVEVHLPDSLKLNLGILSKDEYGNVND